MKTLSLFLLLTSCFLILANPASAHMPGQPAFFLVNGKYADYHPDYNVNNPNPDAPHDIAPETYRANQPITFEIDFTKFPQVTPEQIKQTKFYWKYGDGALANGAQNTHTYTQPGKYVLTIMAKDDTMPAPQLFESIEITIVEDKREETKSYAAAAGVIGVFIIAILGAILRKKKKG